MKQVVFYLLIFISTTSSLAGINKAELDVLEKSMASKTVYIECLKKQEWGRGQGFIISSDGFILTAKHLVEGASQLFGSWIDVEGEEHIRKITLIALHPRFDLALLKADSLREGEFSYFEFDENSIDTNQWVFLGYYHVADKRFVLRGGKIMYIDFSSNLHTLPQAYTSFSTSQEDHGGPCFQNEGKIVGVFLGTQVIHVEWGKFLPYLDFKDWLEGCLDPSIQSVGRDDLERTRVGQRRRNRSYTQ